MNFNANVNIVLDQNTIKIVYSRYKQYVLPLVVIVISFYLFFQFVMPQFQTITDTRIQEDSVRLQNETIAKNRAFIQSLSDELLNDQVAAATSGLPIEKDFSSILTTISLAANNAGVNLGDFDFRVGQVSTPSAQIYDTPPTLNLELVIAGNLEKTQKFVYELTHRLPLADVSAAGISGNSSAVKVSFYYRPVSALTFDNTNNLPKLSAEQEKVLETIRQWQDAKTQAPQFPVTLSPTPQQATPSAAL